MTKVKTGISDPTEPNDDTFEVHTVDVPANDTKTISYDYNYNNEPIISLASDSTSFVNYTAKGTSEVTVQNNSGDSATIEIIVIGN